MLQIRFGTFRLLAVAAALWGATTVDAHQLWVETAEVGRAGQPQQLHVCWGHPGNKETGDGLTRHEGKVSAYRACPGGERQMLELATGSDSFTAVLTPVEPGYHRVGGEIQIGVLTREFHGIAPNTRLVMYGNSSVHISGSEQGVDSPLGLDLEIVPVGSPRNLRPGDLVEVKVLFRGKPIGGRQVEVSLSTMGRESFSDRTQVRGLRWNVASYADPATGKVSFPLIVPGQHVFYLQYVDETPGQYEGDLQFETDYSRLRRGEAYERTLYVSTFTLNVEDK